MRVPSKRHQRYRVLRPARVRTCAGVRVLQFCPDRIWETLVVLDRILGISNRTPPVKSIRFVPRKGLEFLRARNAFRVRTSNPVPSREDARASSFGCDCFAGSRRLHTPGRLCFFLNMFELFLKSTRALGLREESIFCHPLSPFHIRAIIRLNPSSSRVCSRRFKHC